MLVSDNMAAVRLTADVVVLILVLVDVGLGRQLDGELFSLSSEGLNPCFSGCWSRTTITLNS